MRYGTISESRFPALYGFCHESSRVWREDGEDLRAVKVRFPDYITTHTREQISNFGPEGSSGWDLVGSRGVRGSKRRESF
jgi:hypothetical protein